MKVVARAVDHATCPPHIKPYLGIEQTFLTPARTYEVHALSVFNGVVDLQVIDDLNHPSWYPAWLFDVVETALPSDWICNLFHDEPQLVMGPAFVAQDLAAHGDMVDLVPKQVERFWRRVERLRRAEQTRER